MPGHGLFPGCLPPSRELLFRWLDEHDVTHSDGLEAIDVPEAGWGVKATRPMEVVCQIPKTALLSARRTDLPQLIPLKGSSMTSHTILHLALVVLHELRLGRDSTFWGYIQSLPRETVMLPVLWEMEDLGGQDGRSALAWLKGTGAERDLRRKDTEGMSLADLKTFYQATCPHLPPTTTHPEPSPFSAYLHAYALVCTRAFLIDLYLTVALCPFADLFNHSSLTPHSSLQSDDFVCHLCGSLAPCSHDIMSTSGVVRRLEHLPGAERTRLEREVDSVEMRVERELGRGEEVMNCYGEGMGDGRLLVEWGFVGEEFAGEGLGWDVEQLGGDEGVKEVWSKVVERELIASAIIREAGQEDGPQHETGEGGVDRLIRPPAKGSSGSMNLNQSGEISINLFGYLYLSALDMSELEVAEVEGQIVEAVREVETAWTRLRSEDSDDESGDHQLSPSTKRAGIAVINLLDSRLASMHRPRLSLDEIFEMRDALPNDVKLQKMAMTLAINERVLVSSAKENWAELLNACGKTQDRKIPCTLYTR